MSSETQARIRELARIIISRYPKWIDDNPARSVAALEHRYPADQQVKELIGLVPTSYTLGDMVDDA